MRSAIGICMLLLCSTPVYAQYDAQLPVVITAAGMGLHGNVEEMQEAYTDMQSEDGIGEVTERYGYAFDRKGRLQSKSTTITADKQRNERTVVERYHYDRDGNLTSVATYEDDKRQDSVAMFYNNRNRLYRKWTFDNKDRIYKRVQYTWKKHDRLMTVRHKDGDNEIERMIKISYSDDGNTVEQLHLDRQLKQLYRLVTVTDKNDSGGKRVMRFEYEKPDTCTGMISYAINAAGNTIEKTVMDEDKHVTEYTTTTYDAKGNPDSVIQFTTEKWRIHYLHTYDGHNNWIVQAVYKNNVAHHIIGRVIFYRAKDEQESKIIVEETGAEG